jgi:hypothetical protein
MRVNFRIALTGMALACLVLPGVLSAYDYDSDESDVVLRITDEIDLTMHAEVRSRFEWNDNLTDFSDAFDDEAGFVPSRVRLGFGLTLPRDVSVYIEAQELHSFGEDSPARATEGIRTVPGLIGGSGTFAADTPRDDLSLYQAYMQMNSIGDSNINIRIGRQELAFGNEWMLGDNDFYGGLSHDGIRGWWDFDRGRLDAFWIKADENNTGALGGGFLGTPSSGDVDTDLFGVYYAHPEIGTSMIGFDVYGIGQNTAANNATNSDAYWIGTRFHRSPEWGFHFNAEVTYMFGEINLSKHTAAADLDIDAFGGEAHFGYTFDVTGNPDIHGGITYASGDDDPTDSDAETFIQPFDTSGGAAPYADNHGRLGFADVTTPSNLIAYQIGYAGSWENMAWGIELYTFESESALPGVDDDLGDEIDVWFNYQYSRNLSMQVAYSYVDPGDAFVGADEAQRFYVNLRLLL